MVKFWQMGLLKLNFEKIPKNVFSGFCQKFPQAMDEDEIFFCQFPYPWALRVSGMGCYISKCEKYQNHCTLLYNLVIVNKQFSSDGHSALINSKFFP
jgi:hypothetical protein